jgi:hypothetical protein
VRAWTDEVLPMKRRTVDKEAVKKSVAQSTKESAKLEHRSVPKGIRALGTRQQYLAQRRRHS